MTREEWPTCRDPRGMLDSVRGASTDADLRAFACECCRRIWRKAASARPGEDPLVRKAVDVAEAFAAGEATAEELREAHAAVEKLAEKAGSEYGHACQRLGDSVDGDEYETATLAFYSVEAARYASAGDIHDTVVYCAHSA